MNQFDASAGASPLQCKSRVGEVVAGLVVILVGLIFLADNFGIDFPFLGWHNWWAVFIMIGAGSPAGHAIDRYRQVGAIDAQVVHSMISALAVVAVALMFLLDLSLARWWPSFIIIGGMCMLFRRGKGSDRK